MKRVGLILISLCVICLLTSCGGKEKTLECTNGTNDDRIESKQVLTLSFKGDKYNKAVLKQEYILSQNYLKITSLATFKNSILESVLKTDFKDMKYELKDNGKDTITFSINMSKKDVRNIKGSFDSTKKAYEEEGYTCKVI